VYVNSSTNVNITDSTIYNTSASGTGVYIHTGSTRMTGNNITGGNYGVFCTSASIHAENNDISYATDGIYSGFSCGANQIISNNIHNHTSRGIVTLSGQGAHNITGNNLTGNNQGLVLGDGSPIVYHNNIFDNTNEQVYGYAAIELSVNSEGNYWGRTSCPAFIAGTDSNAANVNDSYPYSTINGWLSVSPADCTAPVTTDDAPAGWQNASFSVTLTPSDTGGAGVDYTSYRVDNGTWANGTSVSISTEGNHTVEYYSVDNNNNTESTNTTYAALDLNAPNTTDDAPSGTQSAAFTVMLSATDNMSGVAYTSYRVDNSTWVNGSSVSISTNGNHSIEYYSVDNAGHVEPNTTVYAALQVSGGGGGGGGGTSTTTYNFGNITSGSSEWKLGRGDRVNFGHNQKTHTIRVKSIGSDHAVFEVTSTTQEVRIYTGQTEEVDLDADGTKDIAMTLTGITYNKVLLEVVSLVSEIPDIVLLPPRPPKPRFAEEPVEQEAEVVEAAAPEPAEEERIIESKPVPTGPAPEEKEVSRESTIAGMILVVVLLALVAVLVMKIMKKKR
jgi:hypothetical protein